MLSWSRHLMTLKRWRSVKKKFAATRHADLPTTLCLDALTHSYSPLYGDVWRNARVSLLSLKKTVALLNPNSGVPHLAAQMLGLGAVDLAAEVTKTTLLSNELLTPRDTFPAGRSEVEDLVADLSSLEVEAMLSDSPHSLDYFVPPTRRHHKHIEEEWRDLPAEELTDIDVEATLQPNSSHSFLPHKTLFSFPPGDISSFPAPLWDSAGRSSHLLTDLAAVLPILALDLQPEESFLDLCAGDGLNTVLAHTLSPFRSGPTTCVERVVKLSEQSEGTILTFCPDGDIEVVNSGVHGWTTSSRGHYYDKVLLSAPSQMDRISATRDEDNIFAPKSRRDLVSLPHQQLDLLLAAYQLCAEGGRICYVTQTLSPTQNDAVILAALKRTDLQVLWPTALLSTFSPLLQLLPARFGVNILPQLTANFGPLYFATLLKP